MRLLSQIRITTRHTEMLSVAHLIAEVCRRPSQHPIRTRHARTVSHGFSTTIPSVCATVTTSVGRPSTFVTMRVYQHTSMRTTSRRAMRVRGLPTTTGVADRAAQYGQNCYCSVWFSAWSTVCLTSLRQHPPEGFFQR